MAMTPEATNQSPENLHGPVYKEWFTRLSESGKKNDHLNKLKAHLTKLDVGTSIDPADQAEIDIIVQELSDTLKQIDKVRSNKAGKTAEEVQAFAALPPVVKDEILPLFVPQFLKSTTLPEEQARKAPFLETLLHHAVRDPKLALRTNVEDLLEDIHDLRNIDRDTATTIMQEISVHAIAHNMKLSDAVEKKVDDFLELQGRVKLFESRPQKPTASAKDTPVLTQVMEDCRTVAVGPTGEVDWDAFEEKFNSTVGGRGEGIISSKGMMQIFREVGPSMSSRERMMLFSLDDPKSFALLMETIREDQSFRSKIQNKYPTLSGTDFDKKLMMELSQDYTRFIMKSVVLLYETVLSEQPENSFEEASGAKSGKNDPYDNPQLNAGYFFKMLKDIRKNGADIDLPENLMPYVVSDKKIMAMDIKTNTEREHRISSVEQLPVTISEFAEYLAGVFELNKGALGFGYDLRYSIEKIEGVDSGQEGVKTYYGAIDGYAKQHFTSREIDGLFRMPNSEIVQAACMAYRSIFMQLLYTHGHRASIDLVASQLVTKTSPIDTQIREELKRELKDANSQVEQWEIEWAFNLARTQFYGIAFGFHEALSYADPDLTGDGTNGPSTVKYGYRGLFNPMFGALELNGSPYHTGGDTAFCPRDMDYRFLIWDHEKIPRLGKKMWHESFGIGQAAYGGSFLEGSNLFIDGGASLIGAGGVYTNGGEGFKRMYEKWLYESGLKKDVIGGNVSDVVKGWKAVENIGIDVVRSYAEVYITKDPKDMAPFATIAPYIFDRYFKDPHSNEITPLALDLLSEFGVTDKKSFLSFVSSIGKQPEMSIRKDYMTVVMKTVETVMLFEQMPTAFITYDKQRDSEYGVQLGVHIEMDLAESLGGQEKRGEAHTIFKTALRDLAYVERKGRMESMRDMDKIYEEKKNLFGDLSGLKSEVRGGKGNIIDSEYITKVLTDRYGGDPNDPDNLPDEVKYALYVYLKIADRLVKVPDSSDVERNETIVEILSGKAKVSKKKDEAKIEAKRRKAIADAIRSRSFRSHARVLRDGLTENKFGHSITSGGVANKYLHFTSSHAENVVSTAAQMAGISSETVQIKMRDSQRTLLKEVGTAGIEHIGKAVEVMTKFWGFKGPMAGYGMDNKPITNFVLRYVTTCLMEDDKLARSYIERGNRWSTTAPKAIVDTLFTKVQVKSWNYLDRKKVTDILRTPAIGLFDDEIAKDKIKYRTIPKGHPLAKLPGVKSFGNRLKIRDIPSEFTADSFRLTHNAEEKNIIRYHILPLLMLFLFFLGLVAGKKGSEDMKLA